MIRLLVAMLMTFIDSACGWAPIAASIKPTIAVIAADASQWR